MNDLVINSLEFLAQELEGVTPEELRLNIKLIDILVGLNRQLCHGRRIKVEDIPRSVLDLYRTVMLREIVECIDRGNEP